MEDEPTTTTDIAEAGIVMVTDNNSQDKGEGVGKDKVESKSASANNSAASNEVKPSTKSKRASETAIVDCHSPETGTRL